MDKPNLIRGSSIREIKGKSYSNVLHGVYITTEDGHRYLIETHDLIPLLRTCPQLEVFPKTGRQQSDRVKAPRAAFLGVDET